MSTGRQSEESVPDTVQCWNSTCVLPFPFLLSSLTLLLKPGSVANVYLGNGHQTIGWCNSYNQKSKILETGYNLSPLTLLKGKTGPEMLTCLMHRSGPNWDLDPGVLLCVTAAHQPIGAVHGPCSPIGHIPQNAYFATRGSGLTLEGLCVVAPHTSI